MLEPTRRGFLMASAFAAAVPAVAFAATDPYAASPVRKYNDADWKLRLLPASYEVLRHEETERPGSSPLLNEHRKGTFVCIGCSLPGSSNPPSGSTKAVLAGPASTPPSPAPWPGRLTSRLVFLVPSITAPSAWATKATSSTTDRSPRACATATTASPSGSCPLRFRRGWGGRRVAGPVLLMDAARA